MIRLELCQEGLSNALPRLRKCSGVSFPSTFVSMGDSLQQICDGKILKLLVVRSAVLVHHTPGVNLGRDMNEPCQKHDNCRSNWIIRAKDGRFQQCTSIWDLALEKVPYQDDLNSPKRLAAFPHCLKLAVKHVEHFCTDHGYFINDQRLHKLKRPSAGHSCKASCCHTLCGA